MNTATVPLVSICIPVFNAARFILEALVSAQSQTWGNIEIIVVDNCSTDNSFALAAGLAREDSRIKLSRNAENIGMQRNFNRCLELASGQYIKYLCADDVLYPDCVSRLLQAFGDDPGVVLSTAGRDMRSNNGQKSLGVKRYATANGVVDGFEANRRMYLYGCLVGEPTAVLFRAEHAGRGFSVEYPQLVDLDMWMRILEQGKLSVIADPLCMIRVHDEQLTRQNIKSATIVSDRLRLFYDYQAKSWLNISLPEKLLWDIRLLRWWLRTCRQHGLEEIRAGLYLPWLGTLVSFLPLPGCRSRYASPPLRG